MFLPLKFMGPLYQPPSDISCPFQASGKARQEKRTERTWKFLGRRWKAGCRGICAFCTQNASNIAPQQENFESQDDEKLPATPRPSWAGKADESEKNKILLDARCNRLKLRSTTRFLRALCWFVKHANGPLPSLVSSQSPNVANFWLETGHAFLTEGPVAPSQQSPADFFLGIHAAKHLSGRNDVASRSMEVIFQMENAIAKTPTVRDKNFPTGVQLELFWKILYKKTIC